MSEQKLKRCPCCSSRAAVDAYYLTGCSNIDCQLYTLTMTPEQWNHRPTEDKLLEALETIIKYKDQISSGAFNDGSIHLAIERAEKALKKVKG